MAPLDTFQSVIDAFGGPTKFAEAIGIPGFHAQSMKTRGSIPPAYWVDTVSAAAQRDVEGVTLEKLADIAKAKREAEKVA
jgi:hypothetical protein